jgi:hypothetical protein
MSSHPNRLKIHETTTEGGGLDPVFLVVENGALGITDTGGTETLPLPDGALGAVMAKFGAPLEPAEAEAKQGRLIDVATLDLGDGRSLRHFRHLARWDVIARDYLVYDDGAGGAEKPCALATTVTAALQHLGRAGRRGSTGGL